MTDAGSGRVRQLRAATRRLLARLGSTLLPQHPQDPLSKGAAISRAIMALPHPGRGVRVWLFADAHLVHGLWLCVLEDTHAVHVVEVGAFDGHTQIIVTAQRRRDGQHPVSRSRGKSRGTALPHLLRCGRTPAPEAGVRRLGRQAGRRRVMH